MVLQTPPKDSVLTLISCLYLIVCLLIVLFIVCITKSLDSFYCYFGCVFKLNNYLHDDIFLLSLLKNMGFSWTDFCATFGFCSHLVWNNFVDTDVCLQSLECKPPKNDAFSSIILWLIQLKLRYAVSCYRCS